MDQEVSDGEEQVDLLVSQQRSALKRSRVAGRLNLALLQRIGLRGATGLPFVAARHETEIELRISSALVESAATAWITEPALYGRSCIKYN